MDLSAILSRSSHEQTKPLPKNDRQHNYLSEKHFTRTAIVELERSMGQLLDTKAEARDETWRASRDVLFAEVAHILKGLVPRDSPLLALVKTNGDTQGGSDRPADIEDYGQIGLTSARLSGSFEADSYRLEVARKLLPALKRINETRYEDEATRLMSEDIDRILSRRFLKHPLVLACAGLLLSAVGFAVFGVVILNGMEVNFEQRIRNEVDDAKVRIDADTRAVEKEISVLRDEAKDTKEQLDRFGKQAAQANKDLVSLKDATFNTINNLTTAAANEAKQAMKKLQEGAGAAITAEQKNTIASFEIAGKAGVASINEAAAARANEFKAQKVPEFETMLAKDVEKVKSLDSQVQTLGSRVALIEIAQARLVEPKGGFAGALAAYFSKAVLAVYGVLVSLAVLLTLNVLLLLKLRKRLFV